MTPSAASGEGPGVLIPERPPGSPPTSSFSLNREGQVVASWPREPGSSAPLSFATLLEHWAPNPRDRQTASEGLRAVLAGTVADFETRLEGAGSRGVRLRLTGVPGGGSVCAVAAFSEANGPLGSDASPAEFERMAASLLENLNGMAYRSANDPQWTMLYVNAGCFALTGYRPDELLGNRVTSFDALIHPEDAPHLWEKCQRNLAQRLPCSNEYRIRTASGQEKWVWDLARGVYDETTGALRFVEGIIADITNRKDLEETLARSQATITGILDAIPQSVFWKDREGVYLGCNARFAEAAGLAAAAEIVGKTDFDLCWREHAEAFRQGDQEVLSRGIEKRRIVEQLLTADGRHLWIETSKTLLRDSRGEPSGVIGVFDDMTERKRADEAIHDAEARWRHALEGVGDGVWDLDWEGRQLTVSDAWRASLGYGEEPACVPLTRWIERLHPDDLAPLLTAARAHHSGQEGSLQHEHRIRRADGAYRWVLSRGIIVQRSASGEPLRILGMHTDITERRQAARREQSYARKMTMLATGASLRDLLAAIVEAVEEQVPGARCHVRWLEPTGMLRFMGFAIPGFDTEFDCSGGLDPGHSPCAMAAATGERLILHDLRRETRWPDYCRGALSVGMESGWFEPIRDAAGGVAGLLCLFFEHPGAPTQAELTLLDSKAKFFSVVVERRRADDALRQSEERLNAIFAAVAAGIIVHDRNGRIVRANAAAGEILGLQPDELVTGQRTFPSPWEGQREDGSTIPPEELPVPITLRTGEPQADVVMRLRRAGTADLWLSINTDPIKDAAGEVSLVVSCFTDVTSHRSLAEQVRQAQKMEVIGRLAGGIAHDFNNILGAMTLNLEMLKIEAGFPSNLREPLHEVISLAHRAANFTQQLLAFSRQRPMNRTPLEMNAALARVLALLRRVLGDHITATLFASPTDLWVEADAGMLDQIVMNLCINARDAMPQGGHLTIATSAEEIGPREVRGATPARYARVSIRDTGHGMSPQVLEQIFEPFFSTKDVGRGTGLGLASVHGLVHQHGGWITAESQPGQGATFTFFLPLTDHRPPATSPAPHSATRPRNSTVLLVEDEEPMRRANRLILQRIGCTVLEAVDAEGALRLWRERNGEIDVLISDMVMPGGLTGRDLARQLRRERPALRVIIVSGYSPDAIGADTLRHEDIAFLSKPYNVQALLALVGHQLER